MQIKTDTDLSILLRICLFSLRTSLGNDALAKHTMNNNKSERNQSDFIA